MFDAGGIASKLNLDLSGFAGGMLQATSIAQAFPAVVTAYMANPLLGVIETAKLAAGALKSLAGMWIDAIKEVGNAADNAGEAAAKLGVSVDFLTAYGAVFKDAGSSAEGFAESLKFLNDNAAEAARGGKAAADAFGELGITTGFLQAHLSDTESIARATWAAIAKLPTAAEQTRAARNLLGRGGADGLAAITMGPKGMDELAQTIRELRGGSEKELAGMGDKFGTLQTLVEHAIFGIKRAAAEPVLKALQDHFGDVSRGVQVISGDVRRWVGEAAEGALEWGKKAFKWVTEHEDDLAKFGHNVADLAGKITTVLTPAFNVLIVALEKALGLIEKLAAVDYSKMFNAVGMGDAAHANLPERAAAGNGTVEVLPPIRVELVRRSESDSELEARVGRAVVPRIRAFQRELLTADAAAQAEFVKMGLLKRK
jgi:hypothetical protein